MPILAVSLVAAILCVRFSAHRLGTGLEQAELQALLDEVSERFPNGTSKYVDSSGVAFQMGADGTFGQLGANHVQLLLLEKVMLPFEQIRDLMERERPMSQVYHAAREGMHTSLQGSVSLGDRTFMLGSVRIIKAQRVEANLLWTGDPRSQLGHPPAPIVVGRLCLDLPKPGDTAGLVEGRITLVYGSGTEETHDFFLLSFELDRASLEDLASAPLNHSELRRWILDHIQAKS